MIWPIAAIHEAWERSRAIAESAAAQSPPPDVAPPSAPAPEAERPAPLLDGENRCAICFEALVGAGKVRS